VVVVDAVAPLRTEGLDHVAITVADLERSVVFYSDVLGLERRHEELRVPMFMLASGSGLAIFPADAHPGDGNGDGGVPDVRVMHIAFRVDREQFDRARVALPEAGVEVRFSDHGNVHSLYFQDPDGHALELATYDV
jgi:catechol 2,3-dioxygenase-like lactoylglutathione lyase family enzyme